MLLNFAPTINEQSFEGFVVSVAYYIEYDEMIFELCVCMLATQVLCILAASS
jgi:hypothetical protein